MKTQPLFEMVSVGETINFTQERLGRICNYLKDKVVTCPHCKRPGMRKPLLDGKVRFIHVGRREASRVVPLDACTMWQRTEFKLQFGSDSLHPKYRRPGDEDMTVEEAQQ